MNAKQKGFFVLSDVPTERPRETAIKIKKGNLPISVKLERRLGSLARFSGSFNMTVTTEPLQNAKILVVL